MRTNHVRARVTSLLSINQVVSESHQRVAASNQAKYITSRRCAGIESRGELISHPELRHRIRVVSESRLKSCGIESRGERESPPELRHRVTWRARVISRVAASNHVASESRLPSCHIESCGE
ncbi:hypothetical protein AVEN_106701-1 [Araneus ventricosus]|uniref:Uncharacterized protein n=1 Tax=Araneus ventricosus TaxID=182803 RepID=A0A4Y2F2B6_ARAVE|nr:hypothetical protein AVEN_106701-1 [Araneus ventricosus]